MRRSCLADGLANSAAAAARERWAQPLFVATIVTGSFLLFLTQPMVARMALPRLGGAPAVWNSAMLVYQALLLGGYAYAHWIGRCGQRKQAGLHLGLFAIAAFVAADRAAPDRPAAGFRARRSGCPGSDRLDRAALLQSSPRRRR
jgi:hypothetical protein